MGRKKQMNVKRSVKRLCKKVLILVNHEVVIYNFRLELVERLLEDGYEVHISTPFGEKVTKLRELGAVIHNINFNRHGRNPAGELRILCHYKQLMKRVKPFIVFSYTIKPNIYGAIASSMYRIPFVANITGLGTAVENGGVQQGITILMYRFAFGTKRGKLQRVFFQNKQNEQFFKRNRIALDKHALLPGSGVNLERYPYSEPRSCGDGKSGSPIKFAFISRIMKEKGIDEYLAAAKEIKESYPVSEFHVCGFFEPEYDQTLLKNLSEQGTIIFHGNIKDVGGFMRQMHCIVHPSYYPEGLSNVLLEASACGRPIITTDRAGCREAVAGNGANGYLVAERDIKALIEAIKSFIELPDSDKQAMGKAGRELVERKFDRKMIVEAYMEELHKAEAR